jgi:hypothetical protein
MRRRQAGRDGKRVQPGVRRYEQRGAVSADLEPADRLLQVMRRRFDASVVGREQRDCSRGIARREPAPFVPALLICIWLSPLSVRKVPE